MAQPKIASTPPRCVACWGQYPERVHIDYRADIDGPPVDAGNPRSGHVDRVVICEDCIRSGHRLLPEIEDHRARLAAEVGRLRERLDQVLDYASDLERAAKIEPVDLAPEEHAPIEVQSPDDQPTDEIEAVADADDGSAENDVEAGQPRAAPEAPNAADWTPAAVGNGVDTPAAPPARKPRLPRYRRAA